MITSMTHNVYDVMNLFWQELGVCSKLKGILGAALKVRFIFLARSFYFWE
jgi:hypothetical protein